jgi:PLP dependent protein
MLEAKDDDNLEELSSRLHTIRDNIAKTASRVGRSIEDITLIAVSKTHPSKVLRMAIEAGIKDLGENRVQEAEGKINELGREAIRWHLIGHLQTNKARRAVQLFDVIHSLDSVSLAKRLNHLCEEEGRAELPVLIQINLGEESSKTGIGEKELAGLVNAVNNCERLKLIGLMTIPPYLEDSEMVRPFFRRLRDLRDELLAQNAFSASKGELSMGMSHDYHVAIEEGATMVRVGTAIFGARTTQ